MIINKLEKLTKQDLINKYKELQEEYEDLKNQYEDLDDCYAEMEEACAKAEKNEIYILKTTDMSNY